VSDNSQFAAATGWSPSVTIEEGFARVHAWVSDEPAALTT
jgi:nucleoside-diphosphate-sugar epimerase